MKQTVLVVDDEPTILFSVSSFIKKKGFVALTAPTLKEAKKVMAESMVDAVILDNHLPDGNGIDWIPNLRSRYPMLAIIMITAEGDVPQAVRAMRNGADHFTTKPIEFDDLAVFLNKSLEIRNLKKTAIHSKRLRKVVQPFWTATKPVQEVRKLVDIAAGRDIPVILLGETGTGKGVLANWIHEQSPRNGESFVEINCTSLRGELLVSELFGHKKGAFTSAVEDKQGLIEVAHGGTLFLDEIGDMDMEIQTQFLKVLEEKQFRRLGGTKTRRSDFRLICATNRNLAEEVRDGRFRQDLFYRIHVFPIHLPALRERQADILEMAETFLEQLGFPSMTLSPAAQKVLFSYPWPGNIRELRNVLERAALLAESDTIEPDSLIGLGGAVTEPMTKGENSPVKLDDVEAGHIRKMLHLTGGDTQKTADRLGISRASLYRKIKKYQIEP